MDFTQIALLLVVAGTSGIIAKLLRQPVLVGYLFAGFLLASLGLLHSSETLEGLGQVGVILLLFLVGLEVNIHELKAVGKSSLVAGIGQVTISIIVGVLLATGFGFDLLPSIYIALALTFSSTIIIIKLLSEKNDQDSLYGKISIGILLIQDVVAILVLTLLAGLEQGSFNVFELGFVLIKGIALILSVLYLSKKIIPAIFEKYIANSQELLFVASIAWALGFASIVGGPLGLSYEVGGFLAGLAFANIGEHIQIAAKTRPLRDFFLTIFFLLLGTRLVLENIRELILPVLVFSLFIIFVKPLLVMIIMGLLGHRKRTSFMASVTVAQISEFSLILMAMGASLGHVSQNEVAIIVLTGVVTMTVSTYLIMQAENIFERIVRYLTIFERKKEININLGPSIGYSDHVLLVGGGRTGKSLAKYLKKKKVAVTVVDFSPDVYNGLLRFGIPVVFGDISDPEIFLAAGGDKARLIISTTASFTDNIAILRQIKSVRPRPIVIVEALDLVDSKLLYKKGADYVITPRFLTGEHIRALLKSNEGITSARIRKMGASHYKRLKKLT